MYACRLTPVNTMLKDVIRELAQSSPAPRRYPKDIKWAKYLLVSGSNAASFSQRFRFIQFQIQTTFLIPKKGNSCAAYPAHTYKDAGWGRGGVEHRSTSKKSHATRLQISTKTTWTARFLQTSLLEEKDPVLRISHFTSRVCVDQGVCVVWPVCQHLFLKRKVTFTWRVRYNLVKIYYLCSPLYCNINQRTLWVALCREDGTSSPQYSIS